MRKLTNYEKQQFKDLAWFYVAVAVLGPIIGLAIAGVIWLLKVLMMGF